MVFVTSQSVNSEILRQQSLAKEIVKFQTQISSGQKYDKPSEDPQSWIQISNIGRQQALTQSWTDNLKFGKSRAAQAESTLTDVNNLMTRVTELLVTSTSQGANTPGAKAVAQELQGIKDSITALMNQKDYQGRATFDDTNAVGIPIGQGVTVEAVGTRQSIENNITTPSGTKSIYQILDTAISAVQAGSQSAETAALGDVRAGLDHIIVAQSQQGVRSQRLDEETARLDDTNLNLAEKRSALADTDLTEVIAKVQAKLITLQAAQTAFAKISQTSLFNLIN